MSEAKATNPTTGTLAIERLYVKEQSAKTPYAPGIFQQEGKLETLLEFNIQHYPQKNSQQFEVVLILRVTLKSAQQTALSLEVQQAGLFRLENFEEGQRTYLLSTYCPSTLYPYARKVVADLVSAAGFATLTLPPINFEQLFQQRSQQAEITEQIQTVEAQSPPSLAKATNGTTLTRSVLEGHQ